MERIRKQLKQLYNNHAISCVPSGYRGWDQLTGGLVRGGLTLIGGRPGMGRTSFVLHLVQRMSRQQEGTILFFSPVLQEQDACARLLQIELGMSIGRFFDGSLQPSEAAEKCNTLLAPRKGKIQIRDFTNLDMDYIYDACFSIPDLQMVVVDNPEQMWASVNSYDLNAQNRLRREPMDQVIRRLQNLAQSCDVPVLCTAHMHRSLERRRDKRPKLQDLEKINVPETAVDQVVFLYRDGYYNWNSGSEAQGIVAKTAYGQTGTFYMLWDPWVGKFSELEKK